MSVFFNQPKPGESEGPPPAFITDVQKTNQFGGGAVAGLSAEMSAPQPS